MGETGCLVKERINIYRKHITEAQYQQFAVEEHLRKCEDGRFPFLKIIQENKSLRKSYEDLFIDNSNRCSTKRLNLQNLLK